MTTKTRVKQLTTTMATIAAVLLGVEIAARAVEPALPLDPGKWPRQEMAVMYRQMHDYEQRGREFDVVFVGSSMVVNGIDPLVFSDATGLDAYNAGFAGASPGATMRWTLDVVEPMLSPRVVAFGLTSRDLNDKGKTQTEILASLRTAPGYRQTKADIAARTEGWFERISRFFHQRRAMRTPATFLRNVWRNRERSRPRTGRVAPQGLRIRPVARYNVSDYFRDRMRERVLNSYSIGGRELTALEKLRERLAERGVRLVLIEMPATEDYIGLHPRGREDYRHYRRAIRKLSQRDGIPLVHTGPAFGDTRWYRDPVHLHAGGRRALSIALARTWPTIWKARPNTLEVPVIETASTGGPAGTEGRSQPL